MVKRGAQFYPLKCTCHFCHYEKIDLGPEMNVNQKKRSNPDRRIYCSCCDQLLSKSQFYVHSKKTKVDALNLQQDSDVSSLSGSDTEGDTLKYKTDGECPTTL